MPRLAVIEVPARNAFASGLSRGTGAVTVTRGLLEALDDRELGAVLAHEADPYPQWRCPAGGDRGGLRRGDLPARRVAGARRARVVLRRLEHPLRPPVSRSSTSSKNDRGGGILLVVLALAIMLLAYVLAIGLRLALSRNREFLADAGSVELTHDPDAMITALRKVAAEAELPRLPSQVQAMLLHSAGETLGNAWLATHPSVEDRIAALVRYAGGRDAGPLLTEAPAPPAPAVAVAPGSPWWRQP